MRQRIDLYCLCWNEARMLPYFFRHYDDIVDRYFVFDNGSTDGSLSLLQQHGRVEVEHFDVPGDSFVEEERRLANTIWRNSQADWVIITEIDEHLYHPEMRRYLGRCAGQGMTAIRAIGYEMLSDRFPTEGAPLSELVTTGARSIPHDRLCMFNPKAIDESNFGLGRHTAEPTGRVVWPDTREILLLHYKGLGMEYLIARSAELRQGLRSRDLAEGWGVHYTWSPEQITQAWQGVGNLAGMIPGLGALKGIPPTKYFEEQRIVEQSGLFDGEWYRAAYPDVNRVLCATVPEDAVSHYCAYGWKERRQPNFYFDPEWYCANYPTMHTAERDPLCDYATYGEKEGASPSPRFDTKWYRDRYGLSIDESPLRHYLARRASGLVSPLPDFDVADYCQAHPEVLTDGQDVFESYWKQSDTNPQPGSTPNLG